MLQLSGVGPRVRPRSYRAYLRAVRNEPGFEFKVAMVSCFVAAEWIRAGAVSALLCVAAGVGLVATAGYVIWRIWGT
jgi:hypothetical protein